MKCTYTSINIFLDEHDSCESVADQVCKDLKPIPIKKDERSYSVYTHDQHEEIRLVESFVSNYKENLYIVYLQL